MVKAIVTIDERTNRILNIVKAKYGLKDKSQAINLMALPKKPNRDADKEASCKAHEPRDAGSQGAKASEKDRGCAKQDNREAPSAQEIEHEDDKRCELEHGNFSWRLTFEMRGVTRLAGARPLD